MGHDRRFPVLLVCAIDAGAGRMVRAGAVTDGVDAIIEFGGFETVMGRTFPSRFSVRARSWSYQSTWSHWEPIP